MNPPPTKAPMPPPLDEQETPHLHPTMKNINVLLFGFGSGHFLISGLICQEKGGSSRVKYAVMIC